MATTAQYVAQPILENYIVGPTGDPSRSNPTTYYALSSGPTAAAGAGVGKRITKVTVLEVSAQGVTQNANVVRFWVEPSESTTRHLLAEKAVTATTAPAQSVIGFRTEVPELVGLILPGSTGSPAQLFASGATTGTFHITIESGLL